MISKRMFFVFLPFLFAVGWEILSLDLHYICSNYISLLSTSPQHNGTVWQSPV